MIYFTPGPTQIYPTLASHIQTALTEGVMSISHRSEQAQNITHHAKKNLRTMFQLPQSHHVFFLSSATEGFERSIQNTCLKHSFHFVNGAFSRRWFETSQELGKHALSFLAQDGHGFSFDHAEIPSQTELICMTHNETSTGVRTLESDIHEVAKRHPGMLTAVDIVSSAPFVKFDWTLVDMALFSVQKCFGLPAGLGVMFVSDRAIEKSKQLLAKGQSTGSYHSFQSLFEYCQKDQTPCTPNLLSIYLLEKVCADLLRQSLSSLEAKIVHRAQNLYQLIENHPKLNAFVKDSRSRSQTILTIDVDPSSKALFDYLISHQMEVGTGYGKHKDRQVRIANFPGISDEQFEHLYKVLETF